ncbi:hypothetical protein U9M48_004461 [Paspalum notatum var. saurae]|uniref:Omega-hydroxypalmitate O-feruloyl transferase n=1 Tax=Paspalum notatum var. saurae TaxID=547442 RepID=A0AAQ3PJZ7_PASNO
MKVTRLAPVMVNAAGDAGAAANEEYYFLSNLDQNVTVLMKTIHVFSMSGEKRNHVREIAPLLRESLSRVLRHYYPLQGSLAVRADGTLAVRNDRRGVPFVEAVSDDYELRQVVAAVAATEPGAEVLAGLVYVGDDQEQEAPPLLTVQVTTLKCGGGFVLGIAMNHCLADGRSAAEFLCSWSEMARHVTLSTPPYLDRSVQRARPAPRTEFSHDEFTEVEDVSGLAAVFSDEPCVYRRFTFDAGKLDRLKRAATASGDDDDDDEAAGTTKQKQCSVFVALTAFVWVARTRALRMRLEQKSKLLFAVDGRRRVDPPLPPGFWGNAVVFSCCVSSAGDLLHKPLSAAARSIRDAIARTDDAFIRSAVDYIELNRCRARPALTATTLVTAWDRLGFCAADFVWGAAIHSGPAELPQKEVAMVLQGVLGSHSAVLLTGLPASCVQAFQEMVDML